MLTASQFIASLRTRRPGAPITEDGYHWRVWRSLPPGYRPTREARRRKLFQQQAGVCPYCGCRMSNDPADRWAPHYMTEEHVVPKSTPLPPHSSRAVTGACRRCNELKRDRPLLLFCWELWGQSKPTCA